LDATTLGSLLVGLGAVVGAVVAYLGKRSENAITGYSSLTNDLQEERDRLAAERDALNTRLAEQAALRAADQAEIARLRALIVHLGGEP
jgi:outer membrane murein-binding lipoprotein Lpp